VCKVAWVDQEDSKAASEVVVGDGRRFCSAKCELVIGEIALCH
jgi:hypothetical protein